MIEVNLLGVKKSYKLPVILGIDFNLINIKFLMLLFVISFLRSPFERYFDSINNDLKKGIEVKNIELEKVKKEGGKLEGLKKEIDDFEKKEKKLNEKLSIVRKILKIKKNPMNILLFIAKNIHHDMWLTSINIENDEILIAGTSISNSHIGMFIDNLRSSIYFNTATINLDESSITEDTQTKKKIVTFKIKATIVSYE